MADTQPVTITVQEITPGKSVQLPWGVVDIPATSTPLTITFTPDQLAILKAALAQ